MSKVENNLLTPNQFSKILIFSVIAIGILNLPNEAVAIAKQNGWISVMLGVIYPIYVVICSLYIAGKSPNENIIILNKRIFGKVIGSIFNLAQLFFHIFYIVSEVSGISNFFRVYIIDFLSKFRVNYILIAIAAFCAYKGLKTIGKISEMVFYNLIITGLIGILALTKGSILNIKPIFGSGWVNIFKGIEGSIYSYAGMETFLFLYPYITDKSKLKSTSLKSVGIICFSYTWVTFVTIFYLSHTVIPKTIWSYLYIVESLRVPVINNFRVIMMFFWIFISITALSINYYICDILVMSFFKRMKRNLFYFISVPVMLFISMMIGEEIKRREIVSVGMVFILIFNFMYILLLVLRVYFKKGKFYE